LKQVKKTFAQLKSIETLVQLKTIKSHQNQLPFNFLHLSSSQKSKPAENMLSLPNNRRNIFDINVCTTKNNRQSASNPSTFLSQASSHGLVGEVKYVLNLSL